MELKSLQNLQTIRVQHEVTLNREHEAVDYERREKGRRKQETVAREATVDMLD